MTTPAIAQLFFDANDMDRGRVTRMVERALKKADGGEIYFESTTSQSLSISENELKSGQAMQEGFGVRYVVGEQFAYAHNNEISEPHVSSALRIVKGIRNHGGGAVDLSAAPAYQRGFGEDSARTRDSLYVSNNPILSMPKEDKARILETTNQYLRAKDPSVREVSVSLSAALKTIHIIRYDGMTFTDVRPLIRCDISVILEKDGRRETGNYGFGGRADFHNLFTQETFMRAADEAYRMAQVNLQAVAAPAGSMTVVLGAGWPGVLLHEAVGHGLEGDFNRKGSSAFAGRVGERVAAPGVTVVDQGNIAGRRGSLQVDDEGTPTRETVLIEDGILKGYMQDLMNARLMNAAPTGNGRRESYAHAPMPRMTNTFMRAGDREPGEIIQSVKRGLYAVGFSGGQVDITSGNFVFVANEAYLIEDGKVTAPVKGATLSGNGPRDMMKVDMVGNDMRLDNGIGTCGKAGQGVPVGIGQPTLRMQDILVGGSDMGKGPG